MPSWLLQIQDGGCQSWCSIAIDKDERQREMSNEPAGKDKMTRNKLHTGVAKCSGKTMITTPRVQIGEDKPGRL
jgi:hypothetical protein